MNVEKAYEFIAEMKALFMVECRTAPTDVVVNRELLKRIIAETGMSADNFKLLGMKIRLTDRPIVKMSGGKCTREWFVTIPYECYISATKEDV